MLHFRGVHILNQFLDGELVLSCVLLVEPLNLGQEKETADILARFIMGVGYFYSPPPPPVELEALRLPAAKAAPAHMETAIIVNTIFFIFFPPGKR
ncbi:MAG: hypothetical protein LBG76_09350 [Treponema sp.]|nr:hypothetical protein [Treponema sp.]